MPKKLKAASEPTLLQEASTSTPVAETREELIRSIERTQCECSGVKTPRVAGALVTQVVNLQVWARHDPARLPEEFATASCLLSELGPKTGAEALLAVQMLGVHEAATVFLHRATAEGQTVDGADRNVLRATRLMRLFNDQLAAMAKLKGRTSQQKVTVEHVHVHQGGQAIVGAVSAAPPAPSNEHDPDADPNTP